MFGGYLALAGHDVTLVDTDVDHIDAVRRRGLLLRSTDGRSETIRIAATSDPRRELRPVDAVIVLCKGWANEVVAASIEHAIGPDTWVITVQNGLGNDRTLASVLGPNRVVPGTTTAGAHKPSPGVVDVSPITSARRSITQLASPDLAGTPSSLHAVATALTAAGLPCEILPRADIVIWTKLAMAATAGPLTAVLGSTIEATMASPSAVGLLRSSFDEIIAVALELGVGLDAAQVWAHALETYEAVGPHTTSMADDVASGRRSEIDSFCVEISRLGADLGVATPTHDVIGRLIVALEEQGGLR